ncbi:uncharacterized protein SCHCODRAFT_02608666, partial [Schizophyllum commune H4-8]|uniref:uncharacterized protein n=1 Tax=Schizophyllum commune (strain H4-8 / FGSC 9210) TaxID=578458 RepID=UPI00215F2C79
MPSRFGWVRGLVAEWRVGMTALLRFVRRRPERDDTAVISAFAWPPLHLTVVYGLPITSVLIAYDKLYSALSL